MIDLWPHDIAVIEAIKSPVNILREQASLLGAKTQNLILAEVVQLEWRRGFKDFGYIFNIVAPALSSYRYQLLRIYHNVAFYPLEIAVEEEILESLDIEVSNGNTSFDVESEEQFLQALKAIFNSEKTKRVITALLSQIEPNWEQPKDEQIDF